MKFLQPLILIFSFLLMHPSVGLSQVCDALNPSGIVESTKAACEIKRSADGCDALLRDDPELSSFLYSCPEEAGSNASLLSLAKDCKEAAGEAWWDLIEATIINPYDSIKKSVEVTGKFLNDCSRSLDCKKALFQEAHSRQPSAEDINRLNQMRDVSQMDVLWRTALQVRNSTGNQNQILIQQQSLRGYLESNSTSTQPPELVGPSFWQLVNDKIKGLGTKWSCVNAEMKANMVCYAVFSVVDPTIAVGFAGKITSLGKILRVNRSSTVTAQSASRIGSGAQVTNTALEVERRLGRNSKNLEFTFEKHLKDQTDMLDRIGVKYQDLRENPKGREYIFSNRQLHGTDSTFISSVDKIFEVTEGSKNKKTRSASTNALEHPDFEKALSELHDDGYVVTVDTTLALPSSQTLAVHNSRSKMISIQPNTKWGIFQHEFQHFEFTKFIKDNYEAASVSVRAGSRIQDALPPGALSRYNQKQIAELESFMKADAPVLAANERLSGMRETDVMGFRRMFMPSGNSYTDSFMRKTLEERKKSGHLTTAQNKILNEIKRREFVRNKITGDSGDLEEIAIGYALTGLAPAAAVSAAYSGYTGYQLFFNSDTGETVVRTSPNDPFLYVQQKP